MAKLNAFAFDVDAAREMLEWLDQIHLVALHRSGSSAMMRAKFFGTDVEAALNWAIEQNREQKGVYWTINKISEGFVGKPSENDIKSCRFVHCDIDPPKGSEHDFSVAAILETLETLRCPPSFVIYSGAGIQALWRIEESENKAAIKKINLQIRHMFSADACQDVSRLFRLAGTCNFPNAAKEARGRKASMARIAVPDTGQIYEPHELAAFFPSVPEAQPVAERGAVSIGEYELLTADDLALTPFHPLRRAMERPKGDDRSGYGQAAAHEAVRQGLSDAQIAGLLLNPDNAASAHFIDQEDSLRAVRRAIGRARGLDDIAEGEIVTIETLPDFSGLIANASAKASVVPVERQEAQSAIGVPDSAEFDWYSPLRGGMKEMVDTILYAAPNPRPELALGAALSLFATAAGRRYQSPSGILTNLYCVGLMSSGAGKDFPLRSVGQVLTLAQLEDCVGGRIVSATGIRSALERNPVLFIPIDEFGKLIQAMNAKHGPLHDAISMMLELYSEAQSFAKGGMYANAQERQTVLIKNPCMGFMGVATPSTFWGSMSGQSVVDGFLPRMVLLNDSTPDSPPDRTRGVRKAVWGDRLIEAVKRVRNGAEGHNTFTMGDGSTTPCNPYVVNFADDAANDVWWQMKQQEYEMRQTLPEAMHAFANRLAENGIKMAMVKAVSENPERPMLNEADMQWGRALSKRSIDMFLTEAARNLSDNEYHGKLKKVQSVIADAGPDGISASDLGRKTQAIKGRERDEICIDLEAQGIIQKVKIEGGGRPKIVYRTV